MNAFVAVASTMALAVAAFLGFRLTNLGTSSWWIAGLSVAPILMYPLVWNGSLPPDADAAARHIIHFCMAFVSVLLGLLVIRDLVLFPLSRINGVAFDAIVSRSGTLCLVGLTLVTMSYGYWNGARKPAVVNVQIPIKNLAEELAQLRMVQISDLHAGPSIGKAFVDDVVEAIIELNPQLVLLTGDIADGKFARYHADIDAIKRLTSKYPCFHIVGNHEYLHDTEDWLTRFRELGLTVLLNEHAVLEHRTKKILVAGIKDPSVVEYDESQRPSIKDAMAGASAADLKILLAHQPNIADEASATFQLQLSGHTHAGQFFPWNLVIKVIQKYSRGLYEVNDMRLYVSPGTGYWGPPLRIGTRSEITVITLVKAPN